MAGQNAKEESDDRVREDQAKTLAQLTQGLKDVRQAELRGDVLDVADALLFGRCQDLADPEQTDGHRNEADAREKGDLAEVQPLLSGDGVEANGRKEKTEREHRKALHRRFGAEADEGRKGEHEYREELGRPEFKGLERDRQGEEREEDRRDERSEERRDKGAGEREARLAEAFRKREAIEEQNDGPRLARDVEKDRSDDATEERAPVDAGEKDDRGGRVRSGQRAVRDEHGDGEKDRDAARPAEPGKDPDDETKDDGDEQHRHVDRMERRREPAREVAKDLHLEGKNSRVVQEAFGKAHSEADLEDGENDDREDHRDRPDPPYLVAP